MIRNMYYVHGPHRFHGSECTYKLRNVPFSTYISKIEVPIVNAFIGISICTTKDTEWEQRNPCMLMCE